MIDSFHSSGNSSLFQIEIISNLESRMMDKILYAVGKSDMPV